VAPVGAGWYLRLPGELAVSLAPAYRPVSRRLRPALPTLLRPEHGLVPFLGRQDLLDQVTGWCHSPTDRPVLLVTGGGGSGKTRLGREACVQVLMAGWDAGLADDQHRDGSPTDRLQRPTLLVVDDADLRTGLIAALVGYLRWDDAGPEVRLLLLARAAGAWWDRLVRQQELADAYTVLDLDRHPVPPTGRAEHFGRASTAFADYRDPGTPPVDPEPPTGLNDPAYAEPLLIHIAALLRTVAAPPTPLPGPGAEHAAPSGSSAVRRGNFFGDNLERPQEMRAERLQHGDIASVASARDRQSPNPPLIVPRVIGKPCIAKVDFKPRIEIHGGRVWGNANITEVTIDIASGNIQAAAQGDRKVSKVAADANPFFIGFQRGSR
jgi:hypothetical protein